ncbi:hypothetical protein FEP14_04899 [Burkholderia multivorans]|nr:hypothetical protein [Burkholderia multivorans]MDR9206749.1 hypothetical protein [Burkholderia multivorans]MDR9258333.1 hypothetical protein [Burkholderia multivorans]
MSRACSTRSRARAAMPRLPSWAACRSYPIRPRCSPRRRMAPPGSPGMRPLRPPRAPRRPLPPKPHLHRSPAHCGRRSHRPSAKAASSTNPISRSGSPASGRSRRCCASRRRASRSRRRRPIRTPRRTTMRSMPCSRRACRCRPRVRRFSRVPLRRAPLRRAPLRRAARARPGPRRNRCRALSRIRRSRARRRTPPIHCTNSPTGARRQRVRLMPQRRPTRRRRRPCIRRPCRSSGSNSTRSRPTSFAGQAKRGRACASTGRSSPTSPAGTRRAAATTRATALRGARGSR